MRDATTASRNRSLTHGPIMGGTRQWASCQWPRFIMIVLSALLPVTASVKWLMCFTCPKSLVCCIGSKSCMLQVLFQACIIVEVIKAGAWMFYYQAKLYTSSRWPLFFHDSWTPFHYIQHLLPEDTLWTQNIWISAVV